MIQLIPFEDVLEHKVFCNAAGVVFEEGAVGFKIVKNDEKLGMTQLKFVGDAVYVLNHTAIDEKISVTMLANLFTSVVEFLNRAGASGVIYPISNESDREICEAVGFDRVSETLYVFDFPQEEGEHGECDCGHHH